MKLQPVRLLNHPEAVRLKLLEHSKADREQTTARSFHQLVTRQGVAPAKAKQLLGLE